MAKKQVKVEIVAEGSEKFSAEMRKGARSVKNFGDSARGVTADTASFMKGMTQMAGALGLANTASALASKGLDTLKDSLMHNETILDEWSATCEESKSKFNYFLSALSNADFSNFLTNMREVAAASRAAYAALDDLATNNAFAQVAKSKFKAEYDEALEMYKLDPTGENKEKVKAANDKIVAELTREAQDSWAAYEAGLRKLAKERGLNEDMFMDLFQNGSTETLKNLKGGYSKGTGANMFAEYWNGNQVQGNEMLIRGLDGVVQERRKMTEEEQRQFEVAQKLSKVNDDEIDQVQKLGAAYYNLESAMSNQKRSAERMLGETGKVSTGAVATAPVDLKAQMDEAAIASAAERMMALVQDRIDNGEPVKIPIVPDTLGPGMMEDEEGNIWSTEEVDAWEQRTMDAADMVAKRMQNVRKSVDESSKAFSTMGSLAGSVGTMVGGELGNLIGTMGSMIGQIGSVIASLTTEKAAEAGAAVASGAHKVAATSAHWYEIIPGIAAVTAAIVSTLAGFEQGGVVGGSSYSGDKMLIRANSGERVLTAEQNEIFENLLEGGGDTGGVNNKQRVQFEIKNDRLVGTLSNASARQRYRV